MVAFFFGCSLVMLKSAGSNVKVNSSETITPKEAYIPRSEIGATAEPENDPTPIAVVIEVIAMAKPECPSV